MTALRRIVTVLVMVYLLMALLLAVTAGARDAMISMLGTSRADFWFNMMLIGAGLLLLLLLVENAHTVALRRNATHYESKINELKAKLYDHQLEQRDQSWRTGGTSTPRPTEPVAPPAPVVPQPQAAPGSIARTTMPPVRPLDEGYDQDLPRTAVPPPSAADLPPSAVPPTTIHPHPADTPPYPNDRPAV
ncbi:hypothetical protein [Hymenobacter oligotrophus]|uniref:hypothetical protein n=1 Tax=Hymenobacter oligotrophus TaxID=2319843 RepID=UPI0013C2E9E4|nr:hypothetical protein [Hymenobacter oligotrophus]